MHIIHIDCGSSKLTFYGLRENWGEILFLVALRLSLIFAQCNLHLILKSFALQNWFGGEVVAGVGGMLVDMVAGLKLVFSKTLLLIS